MNASLTSLELAVLALGIGVLLLDLWTPREMKARLGYAAAFGIGVIFLFSFSPTFSANGVTQFAFGHSYVLDGLAMFFKRFFLLAAVLVTLMAVEFSDRIETGISEYYSLILFALLGMLFASSANDFTVLFVSLELITITFYILTSFRRSRLASLEAGIKYLILGGVSSAFLIYGVALVYGTTGSMAFGPIADKLKATPTLASSPVLILGFLLILSGLGFKIAAFPFQIWAPDVYQGAPPATTAFLAVGSKAAGIVLLLRLLDGVIPGIGIHGKKLLIVISAVTILYGSLCAIPQRNLKRLMGYSSIANAGYLLLGLAAMSHAGSSAVLFYLAGYLFTVLGAFTVLTIVLRETDNEDIGALAGLGQRSPLLAGAMTTAMVSLAGIPPLTGFFGKFLLMISVVEQGATRPSFYWLLGVAIIGVVISIYYYFGVIRVIYWSRDTGELTPIRISRPARVALYACVLGMLYLGLFPDVALGAANEAVKALNL